MNSPGTLLAALQLAFAFSWVVYVIYLPALAQQAGLPKSAVPWILLLDQAIFVAFDWLAGVMADRVARLTGRIGMRMAAVAVASGAAFVLMPWIAPSGSPAVFLALVVVWSATSSALRAPPLSLFARHAANPRKPWLAGLYLLGLGIAGALAPYAGVRLRGIDPRLPFAVATVVVVAATFAIAFAERRLAPPAAMPVLVSRPGSARVALFAAAVALFALGFQLHFAVNSATGYLRFAKPADLEHLMPVFWIGFNLAVLPATLVARRYGGLRAMAAAGVVGALAAGAATHAGSLQALVAIQLAAGAAWGVVLTSAFTAALDAGTPGREGSATGLLFSMLALAAFARIAFVAADFPRAEIASYLVAAPAIAWSAAVLLAVLALRPAAGAAR